LQNVPKKEKPRRLFRQRGFRERVFGKKRGRKEDLNQERERLTASAAFLAFIIIFAFEQPINELKTK